MSNSDNTGAPPRVLIIISAAVAGMLVVAVAVAGALGGSDNDGGSPDAPLPLAHAPAPRADSAECSRLLRELPRRLDSGEHTLTQRTLATPAPPAAVAWGGRGARVPVVLRCGVPRPAELSRTSKLRVVQGVQWLPVTGSGAATWYAVDRDVYVALTVPNGASTGPIQAVSDAVDAALEPTPLEFPDG